MPNTLEDLAKTNFQYLYDNNFYIADWKEDDETIALEVKGHKHPGKCPFCGEESTKTHGHIVKKIQDIPYAQKTTYLNIQVNRYICMNPECSHKTFVEDLEFVGRKRHRTFRLDVFILSVARMMSNKGASEVLQQNHVQVSHDSINRLYQRLEFKEIKKPTEIGIDDVAILKGHDYATVIYDSETNELLALLPERGVEETKKWLLDNPQIERVARDRLSSYAQAISEVLPECEQVADRFHLLKNMSDRVEDILKKELPNVFFFKEGELLKEEPQKIWTVKLPNIKRRKEINKLEYNNDPPVDEKGNSITYDDCLTYQNKKKAKANSEKRKKKQQLIKEIQEYWNGLDKKNYSKTARTFNLSITTVRKYIRMSEEEINELDHPRRKKRRTFKPIYDWLNVIYKMLDDGYRPSEIFYYIRSRAGLELTDSSLRNAISMISQNNFPNRKSSVWFHQVYPPEITIIHRKDLINYIISGKSDIVDFEKYFEIIMDAFPLLRLYDEVYKLFYEVIMGDEEEKLDFFLESVDFLEDLEGFCEGIKKDIEAVKNSISSELNSGFVEGLNCKFKLIKRILYGRSKLVNLEKKCFLCFMKDWSNEKLLEIIKNTFKTKSS